MTGVKLLECYRSYDGEAAGAISVAIFEDGPWVLENQLHRTLDKGTLAPASMAELRQFLAYWSDMARRRANGWCDPVYGGCTNPISMGAVRCGDVAIHFRLERFGEFSDLEMSNREKTILSLFKKLTTWIPELSKHEAVF